MIVTELKLLPLASSVSKYSLDDEKLGWPTGSDPYCETVNAPSP